MPALPLHEAGKYVAAAYIVVFALVLIYVAIMAIRLSHVERDLGELLARAEGVDPHAGAPPPAAPAYDSGHGAVPEREPAGSGPA